MRVARFKVENHPDGMMTITAHVPAPHPPIASFDVSGAEAVKRYKKWIMLVGAGMLAPHAGARIVRIALAVVDAMEPDSDGDMS